MSKFNRYKSKIGFKTEMKAWDVASRKYKLRLYKYVDVIVSDEDIEGLYSSIELYDGEVPRFKFYEHKLLPDDYIGEDPFNVMKQSGMFTTTDYIADVSK